MILVLWLILLTFAYAQEITGAFGIKFGEKLSNLKVTGQLETTTGDTLYTVNPPKPIKVISLYAVEVTPITKRIYSIWGYTKGLTREECKSTMEAIMQAIERKYGVKRKKVPFAFMFDGYYFEKGDKTILVKCNNTIIGGHDLYLVYSDEALEKQAKKEAVKLKSKEIDESGL